MYETHKFSFIADILVTTLLLNNSFQYVYTMHNNGNNKFEQGGLNKMPFYDTLDFVTDSSL